MDKEGPLPLPVKELPTGSVVVHGEAAPSDGVALNARVCKRRSKSGLRQTTGLGSPSWLSSKPLHIVKAVQGGRLRDEGRSEKGRWAGL
ncbi:hypothetical protein MPNT_50120 [Candidatus Methylacidithermus pantelleriae]|uniref:Uncharacterized protein n=1 Tax=Candidatus Methylacidithermus pantelleriae TaxID=2744239 RepID=A0A8J2BRV0_9BACT|nr:hypothetical protein MPNT_50120 [Candidatus Methylacidithermus pantelleriae]